MINTRTAIDIVCQIFAVEEEKLFKKGRVQYVVCARAALSTLLRECNGMSYPQIASIYGYDHGTIIHHIRKIEDSEKHDKKIWQKYCACYEMACKIDTGLPRQTEETPEWVLERISFLNEKMNLAVDILMDSKCEIEALRKELNKNE